MSPFSKNCRIVGIRKRIDILFGGTGPYFPRPFLIVRKAHRELSPAVNRQSKYALRDDWLTSIPSSDIPSAIPLNSHDTSLSHKC